MDAEALEAQKQESDPKSPPTSERPVRERKTVERFSALSSKKPAKVFSIAKGRGTALKDIPNVAFKLSKRKPDENLQVLHRILFGTRGKTSNLKRDIHQFSGFVWLEDEEKQRAKTKEKLDKCVKEKLLDFCDVLDIPVLKSTTKKEELSAKLLDFLESPHSTTEILLADKQQAKKSKKRKRKVSVSRRTSGEASSKGSSKKRKQKDTKEGAQPSEAAADIEDEAGSSNSKGDSDEDSDHDLVHTKNEGTDESADIEESEAKEDEVMLQSEKKQKKSGKKSIKDTTTVPVTKKRTPAKSLESDEESSPSEEQEDEMQQQKRIRKVSGQKSLKKGATANSSVEKTTPSKSGEGLKKSTKRTPPSKLKESSSKQLKKSEKEIRASSSKKPPIKSRGKQSAKQQDKPKAVRKRKTEPTSKELHAAVSDILDKVDFNTATLSDIVKQLGVVFGTDLMHRKAEVKGIIEIVMEGMSDDEGNAEEADDAGESGDDAADDTAEAMEDAAEKDEEDAAEEEHDETKEEEEDAGEVEARSDAEDSDETPDA